MPSTGTSPSPRLLCAVTVFAVSRKRTGASASPKAMSLLVKKRFCCDDVVAPGRMADETECALWLVDGLPSPLLLTALVTASGLGGGRSLALSSCPLAVRDSAVGHKAEISTRACAIYFYRCALL